MDEGKQRHGCLTAWLIGAIVLNALIALLYLFGSAFIQAQFPNAPRGMFVILAVGAMANVACAVALFRWKKWGFYGSVACALVAFVINVSIGVNPFSAILGLSGLAILYGVLQIGGEKKGWTQLD